jgi:BirA family biotin operon repressor/biotin-[acetyl-CoA-carboxylase] ligase
MADCRHLALLCARRLGFASRRNNDTQNSFVRMSTRSQKRANALFDADQIRAATFVRHVEIHDTLGSTNDRAAELARESNIELPALIVARHQTAGRGRGRNSWWAADGALTFSVLLEPAAMGIRTESWPQLSLATAAAVRDALEHELLGGPQTRLRIKAPNDVLLDGRKVSGILIDSPGGAPPAKNRVIIGIGINVNNSWHTSPTELNAKGTALCDSSGRQHELAVVLIGVLRALEKRLADVEIS